MSHVKSASCNTPNPQSRPWHQGKCQFIQPCLYRYCIVGSRARLLLGAPRKRSNRNCEQSCLLRTKNKEQGGISSFILYENTTGRKRVEHNSNNSFQRLPHLASAAVLKALLCAVSLPFPEPRSDPRQSLLHNNKLHRGTMEIFGCPYKQGRSQELPRLAKSTSTDHRKYRHSHHVALIPDFTKLSHPWMACNISITKKDHPSAHFEFGMCMSGFKLQKSGDRSHAKQKCAQAPFGHITKPVGTS